MSDALKNLVRTMGQERKETPQGKRTAGQNEVRNHAGGYVFSVSDKARLERLLILGSAGNTYYASAESQAKDALKVILELINKDEAMVLDTVRSVSVEGRALKQDTTLFALAALLCYAEDKAAVRAIFNDIVRIPTHLFTVCQYIDDIGGWGSAKTKAVAGWFTDKSADELAYAAIKYRSRTV